jgi:hypothetical protein
MQQADSRIQISMSVFLLSAILPITACAWVGGSFHESDSFVPTSNKKRARTRSFNWFAREEFKATYKMFKGNCS